MTDETPSAPRRRLLLGGAVATVAVAGLAFALTAGGPEEPVDPAPSGTPSSTAVAEGQVPDPTATTAAPAPAGTDVPARGADVPAPDAGDPADSAAERPDGRAQTVVPLEQPAQVRAGVTARISQIEAVEAEANLPGEIGGPALRVTVEVRNDTTATVDLTSAVVNAYVGPDARPAVSVVAGSEPFPADVAPGGTATSRVVFTIPAEDRADVRLELDLAVGDVVALFSGSAAGI